MTESQPSAVVELSSKKFLLSCGALAFAILAVGSYYPLPSWAVAVEVLVTVLFLFIFGSIRYRIDKNALTYGAVLVILASFWWGWWPSSGLKAALDGGRYSEVLGFFGHYGLTLHGLDALFHADTMLFILGLTFFVCVIAQTRLLETISFGVLNKNRGNVVATVAILTAIVSFASGILDGVSMIGLMIRTLVIILFLAGAGSQSVIYAVIVSTIVTTVCGMWLAYGEPPNLIMKANLHPYLDNQFFLRYCLPVAIGSYFIVFFNIRKRLRGKKVNLAGLDILDRHTADVRFLQAARHGEVLTPIEFLEDHADLVGDRLQPLVKRLQDGESLGSALMREKVPEDVRKVLLGKFVAEDLAEALDHHYRKSVESGGEDEDAIRKIREILKSIGRQRVRAQTTGILSFIPFIGLLVWHAIDHSVPLFLASFAGFATAFTGIYAIPAMRRLALREAYHEYKEYIFLLPLFLSITLLQKTGFFSQLSVWMHAGIEKMGVGLMAYLQFSGATFLSAMLDNNVVADFASRALHGLDIGVLHLFSMAQIAGYAAGGCWTHIGSAQSVVAYAFIQREVDEHYTPFQWIRAMTPVILEIFVLMIFVIWAESLLMRYWG